MSWLPPEPDPDPSSQRRRGKSLKKGIALAVIVVLAVLALVVPLPVFVLAPGSAISVGERVELGRPPDPLSGAFLLTTVRIFQPSVVGVVQAWLDDSREVLPREEVVPAGVGDAEFEAAQRALFRESSEVAAAVGLRAAGADVTIAGSGARVAAVSPGSPADGVLREGDVITGVDGQPVALANDLIAALSSRAAGDEVGLVVQRDGAAQDVAVRLGMVEGVEQAALGVGITTVDLDVSLPFPVEVDQGNIGGPSAGLLIALTVYDLADPADLAAGRTIAGTGTIDLDGEVGEVGGVDAKVVAARASGATLFLVPEAELELARETAGDDLEVIPVATIDDAIAALQQDAA